MPCNISLDSPFLEQQSVREMLNWVTEGVSESVRLEDLIKIARTVIQSELVDCGCDENELTGLKLSYEVTHPQDENLRKAYSIEWNLSQAELADSSMESKPEASNDPESKSPISTQLMSTLFTRLDEARTTTDAAHVRPSGLRATFREINAEIIPFCIKKCGSGGDTKGWALYSVDDNGVSQFIKCTGEECPNTSPRKPTDWEIPII